MSRPARYEAVVIGASAGGMQALKTILLALPASFPLPVVIVQHINERSDNFLAAYLDGISELDVIEADAREPLSAGVVYLAPAGYHLLIEPDRTFSLSVDPRVNYVCPAVDVLFESAADVFDAALIGVVLTGANADGARGLKKIREAGGLAIVQNPQTAEARYMPQAALDMAGADHIVELEKIAPLLADLSRLRKEEAYGTGTNG